MKSTLKLEHISKSYNSLRVLSDVSAEFSSPGIYCLTAPSGAGKTTLFRLIMGLEKPDAGSITHSPELIRFSTVFQEDRLIDHLSPLENIALVLDKKKMEEMQTSGDGTKGDLMELIRRELLLLLPAESLSRPVDSLSGGMKRRCAFLRAMMAPSDIVIMDEPFTGLDDGTKEHVIRYLLEHQKERLFLIATHHAEDIKKLGAVVISLDSPPLFSGR